ncbi:AraC family transcriptional regulator [Mesorhizobium ephedrae]|jgi:AraC family transcriptional activator of pobA|uniref:AraC family transcriptional regulator n=2 Tax=Kumtagia ephedrae TaxID=2116701 RepID=A0A2P7SRM7_9HYPH|nr:helix-turn-helix domain-containing protein [Mesorhizobium ephedrae]PSJ65148.1 AraC family transcriptional regulator [Mesorhizobium ephedrae]
MSARRDVPEFFVYGEPSRPLEVGFLHVETVMERKSLHFGHVAPHQHPSMGQITYWFRGSGTYRIEDETWNFSAPTVSFVPSNVIHGFDVDVESDAFVISISDGMLKTLAPRVDLGLDAPVFITGGRDDAGWAGIGALVDMIAAEYRTHGPAADKVLTGLIGVVLSLIARLGEGSTGLSASPTVALAAALRRAVDRHFRKDLPVGAYVELLATTPHLLDKAAHEVFGSTVKDMLQKRRLLEAKRLLMFTIRPVEDIGREVGFGDPAYFSRFFRRHTGEAPSAWRRRHLEQDARRPA